MSQHEHEPADDSPPPPGGVMTFGEHLEELRRRLILALMVPLPVAVLAFVFADAIRAVITAPLYSALEARRLPTQVQALSPIETLTTDLFLAVILALVLSAPWLIYQLWKFVEPGLYTHERRFARFLMPSSAVLVAIGLAVLYWIMLPLMLLFLVGFGQPGPTETFPIGGGPAHATQAEASKPQPAPRDPSRSEETQGAATVEIENVSAAVPLATLPVLDTPPASLRPGDAWVDAATAQIRVAIPTDDGLLEIRSTALVRDRSLMPAFRLREYVDFVLLLALAISIAFQMPLVILLLGWVGIVDVATLRKNRKYAFLACAVLAAVMTPPDFVSMSLLLGPLYGLYELGILLLVLLPPESLSRGSIVHDALDRVRRWRRRDRSPRDGDTDANSSSAMPPPVGAIPRGAAPSDREPDGEADEDLRPDESVEDEGPPRGFGGTDPAGEDHRDRDDDSGRPWP